MIVCICNGLRDEDIKEICDSCENKEEFTNCINAKMKERSCRSCYCELIDSFETEGDK
jgi:bacterioferritin-associated ferredoxin